MSEGEIISQRSSSKHIWSLAPRQYEVNDSSDEEDDTISPRTSWKETRSRYHEKTRRSSRLPSDKLVSDSTALKLPGEMDVRLVVPETSRSSVADALKTISKAGGVFKTSSEIAVTGVIDTARLAGDMAVLTVGGYGWYDGHKNIERARRLRDETMANAEQSLRIRTDRFESRELDLDQRKRELEEEGERQRKARIDLERRDYENTMLAGQLQKQRVALEREEVCHRRLLKDFEEKQLNFQKSKAAHENSCEKLREDQLEILKEKQELQQTSCAQREEQEAFEDAEKLANAVQSDVFMVVNRKLEELTGMQRKFLRNIAAEKNHLQVEAAAVQIDSKALARRRRDFEDDQAKHESRRYFEKEDMRTRE